VCDGGFGECEICVAGIYERGGVYTTHRNEKKGDGVKNIRGPRDRKSGRSTVEQQLEIFVTPSCVQVVEDLFAVGCM
jgi:hypothetical protein